MRQLQSMWLGRLEVAGKVLKTVVTQVPKDMRFWKSMGYWLFLRITKTNPGSDMSPWL